MNTATVLRWNRARGIGFLAVDGDNSNCDLYTHYTRLLDGMSRLNPGQRVTFEYAEYQGRRIADNVRLVEAKPEKVATLAASLVRHGNV